MKKLIAILLILGLVSFAVGCTSTQNGEDIPMTDKAHYEITAYQLSYCAQNGTMAAFKNPKEQDKTALVVSVRVVRTDESGEAVARAYSFDPVRNRWWPDQFTGSTASDFDDQKINWTMPWSQRAALSADQRLWPTRNEIKAVRKSDYGLEYVTFEHEWTGSGDPFGHKVDYGKMVSRTYVRDKNGVWSGEYHQIPWDPAHAVYPVIDVSGRAVSKPWGEMLEQVYHDHKND